MAFELVLAKSGSIELVQLMPNLHRMARRLLGRSSRFRTLSPTDVVHQALLQPSSAMDGAVACHASERSRFLALMSTVMHRIVVDHARRTRARGKALTEQSARSPAHSRAWGPEDWLTVDDLIERFSEVSHLRDVAIMRIFGGVTIEETARALNVSVGTVKNRWAYIRDRLRVRMRRT